MGVTAIVFLFIVVYLFCFFVALGFELGLTLARQVLCHLSHSTSPIVGYFI
jgi:hypothetical protein